MGGYMASKVQIINFSLTLLGMQAITSINDETEEARIANRIYDMSLEEILGECLWTFATKRALLTLLNEDPVWTTTDEGLLYVYQKPNDVIRTFGCNVAGAIWKEEAGKILSDTSGLGIIYTYLNTDPSSYTPEFTAALATKLAYDMSFSFLNSSPKRTELLETYEKAKLPTAKSKNSQIGSGFLQVNDNYWSNARFGGAQIQEFQ